MSAPLSPLLLSRVWPSSCFLGGTRRLAATPREPWRPGPLLSCTPRQRGVVQCHRHGLVADHTTTADHPETRLDAYGLGDTGAHFARAEDPGPAGTRAGAAGNPGTANPNRLLA